MEKEKDINRIKVVLVEKKRTNKWLAKQLEKDPATVSKWCTNTSQPSLETLLRISQILAYIIHSGFISGYQNRYGDNLKPPTNVYHRMTA